MTIPHLLGRELTDERALKLTAAPALLFRRDEPGSTRYALLIDAELDRRRLMDLLYTVAPYKAHGPDRFSRVLDNWALIERAKTGGGSESLMQEHARSLKSSWEEFLRHRDAYVAVFEDEAGERSVVPLLRWSRSEDGKRHWEFEGPDTELLEAIDSVRPVIEPDRLDMLIGLVTIPYYLPELRKNWQAWRPLARGGKSNYVGPASVPVMALLHRRALLNSSLVQRVEEYAAGPSRQDLTSSTASL